jgi:hypothetical protein
VLNKLFIGSFHKYGQKRSTNVLSKKKKTIILKIFFFISLFLSKYLKIKKIRTINGTMIPITLVAIASEHVIDNKKAFL